MLSMSVVSLDPTGVTGLYEDMVMGQLAAGSEETVYSSSRAMFGDRGRFIPLFLGWSTALKGGWRLMPGHLYAVVSYAHRWWRGRTQYARF